MSPEFAALFPSAPVAPALLHRAMQASQHGITIAANGPVDRPLLYVNPAFTRITGYTSHEMLGRDCRLLQRDLTGQPWLPELRTALREGRETTVLLRNFRKDGTPFWNELVLAPVPNKDGVVTHFIGIQQDVTRREDDARRIDALHRDLSLQADALRESMREVEAFSYSAAHELRGPARRIAGFAQALQEQLDAGSIDGARAWLQRIRANAQRMDQSIDALFLLAEVTRQPLSLRECDLGAIASEVLADLSAGDPREVRLRVQPGLRAQGDPGLLRHLLQNLLGNAWKYSARVASPLIEFGRDADGEFFVRDNGAGFDSSGARTLFQAFKRFHEAREFAGTGIGLSIAQRIVLRHGGAIRAESAPGQGATFWFSLAPSSSALGH